VNRRSETHPLGCVFFVYLGSFLGIVKIVWGKFKNVDWNIMVMSKKRSTFAVENVGALEGSITITSTNGKALPYY